ncbi:hypothetical protein COV11_00470 [Candidatus Woesearchaeota archaeon CG10_big_fil_rev_8_21_14_0_10_30_7]|nr:MAG: hypothetical protein COV11_00470 [Candidatus Woesearchaeota archaeon CG10_big_fil_rev_8_21_14_0_10_30_7]
MVENNAMNEHYYTKKPTSFVKENTIKEILRGEELTFITSSGLFSPKKIDKGTKLLIEESLICSEDKILDLGCGYGVVGISIKKKFPKTKITLLDVNERALSYAKKNSELNKTEVEIVEKLKNKTFNTILLNPPQSAGKKICFELINLSNEHLSTGGSLQIVARHKKGGKLLETYMNQLFGNVEVIARKSGYKIYLSKKLN